ncbi:A10/OS-D family protein, partial [Microbacterium aurugineum]|uniref:A10/OS-D family protein n=1 Tax=Microbacterium aurugineum TaxID=2851642 RepID=UPI0039BDE9D8
NMKTIIVCTLVLAALAWAKPADYSDKWDYINVDEILESQRLLKGYVDCLLERGKCTSDGKALKDTLPDALENDCSKCTQKQKEGAEKVLKHLINKRQDLWKELAVKYDPKNIYQQKYKEKIEAAKHV